MGAVMHFTRVTIDREMIAEKIVQPIATRVVIGTPSKVVFEIGNDAEKNDKVLANLSANGFDYELCPLGVFTFLHVKLEQPSVPQLA